MNIYWILFAIPWLIIAFTIHGFIRSYIAYKLWDTNIKKTWTLTINPLYHIDPLWFILILIAWFWWGKPSQINEQNLKDPINDPMKIWVLAVIANGIIAILLSAILWIFVYFWIENQIFYLFILSSIYVNWALFFLNMIPIPPFTGSMIFFNGLKHKNPELYNKIYTYALVVLIWILVFWAITGKNLIPLGTIVQYWTDFFLKLFHII